jgi:CubicO group peptidase (beta-lactamase class C family)
VKAEPNISEFLRQRIAAGDFPSAVYLVGEKGSVVFADALGRAVVEPEQIEARVGTIYDLASLTKPLVTGFLCAKLLETGQIHLSDPISKYFPQFNTQDKAGVTLRQLLTHISGFAAWKPFYLLTRDDDISSNDAKKDRMIELIAAEPLAYEPRTKVVYSDLNYLLLGFFVEKLYGGKLDAIAKKEIFEPLGLAKTFFNPPAELKREIAASEHGNKFEKQTCKENGYDASKYGWREEVIWGEVHDGNAYFLDGVAGHAGLFSTAEEVFKIACQFLAGSSQLLSPEICKVFTTDHTPGLNEARTLGFQLAATPESTASEALAKDSFGHLGFTGTSLWIEPETERVFILLTNRTHAHDLPFVNINSVRRDFHRRAVAALEKR